MPNFSRPIPLVPVPLDDFTLPPTGQGYVTTGGGSIASVYAGRPRASEDTGDVSFEGEDKRVSGSDSTHRFTYADDDEAQERVGFGRSDSDAGRVKDEGYDPGVRRANGVERGGWEHEGGRRRRNLWCLLLLIVVGVVVGIATGVTRGKSSPVDSAVVVTSSFSPSSLLSSALSHAPPSTLPSIIFPPSASTPETPAPTATTTVQFSGIVLPSWTSTAGAGASSSILFAYAANGQSTTTNLEYSIPTSGVETRGPGQLQFTQTVVLADLAGGTFTTALRFRVPAPSGS